MMVTGPNGIQYDLRQSSPTITDEVITLRSAAMNIDGIQSSSQVGADEVILRKASDLSYYATILKTNGVEKVLCVWAPGGINRPTTFLPVNDGSFPGLFTNSGPRNTHGIPDKGPYKIYFENDAILVNHI